MTKFKKRLHKLSRNHAHALVLGSAFGILDQVVEIYNTVFVVSAEQPAFKAKNLVYKETIIWQKINPGYHREHDEKRPIN